MHPILLLTALWGCGSSETPTPADAPAPAPAVEAAPPKPATAPPQPEVLPPPVPAKGGPRVLIPGNYLPAELQMADGEAVRVICKDRLVDGRVSLIPVGEGRVTPNVPQCPKWQILFRGLEDRMGPGTIVPGVGRGPFGAAKGRPWSAGHQQGVFTSSGPKDGPWVIAMEPDGGERIELATVTKGTGTSGLNWIGDLDDDNVPDFVLNTPQSRTKAHMRLFLSAKSADRKPEQVEEFVFTLW